MRVLAVLNAALGEPADADPKYLIGVLVPEARAWASAAVANEPRRGVYRYPSPPVDTLLGRR